MRLDSATIHSMPQSKDWDSESWEPSAGDVSGAWDFWDYETPDTGDTCDCADCGELLTYNGKAWLHDTFAEGAEVWFFVGAGLIPDKKRGTIVEIGEDAYQVVADDVEYRVPFDGFDVLYESQDDDGADHDPDASAWDDEHRGDGPMMSYWYPCPLDDPAEAARTLATYHLPLCVVSVDGEHGLALTGGGMDLSWEICEAFARLGFCPPLHYCDLPRMAGRESEASTPFILAACARTTEIAQLWATNSAERVAKLASDYGITIPADDQR